MPKAKEEIIEAINGYILKKGGDYTAWYIGIGEDAKAQLFSVHHVKHGWIYETAATSSAARAIQDYFVSTFNTVGGCSSGDDSATMVYAYKMNSKTAP
jgi:hypothetical protein